MPENLKLSEIYQSVNCALKCQIVWKIVCDHYVQDEGYEVVKLVYISSYEQM